MKNLKNLGICLLAFGFLVCASAVAWATDNAQIETSFLEFQKTWIQKLNKEGKYGEKSMRVEKSPEDRSLYIATYDLLKESAKCRVKPTGQQACPYVGVMRYEIWTCAAKGRSQEEAKSGPFECRPQTEMTEIFRYSGGMWVY